MAYGRKRKQARSGWRVRPRGVLDAVGGVSRTVWNNRKTLYNAGKKAYNAVKRKFTPKNRPTKRRKKIGAYVGNSDAFIAGNNDLSRMRATIGRYPKLRPTRLLKLINVGMTSRLERFQGITNFDTNTGYFTIANRLDTTTGVVTQPLHVYNLTIFKNSAASTPTFGTAYGWTSTTGSADPVRQTLLGQSNDGIGTTSTLQSEKATLTSGAQAHHVYHDWSHIKLNLYGARSRPTWFKVSFVQVKNELCNFAVASTANERFGELINALTGNMTYSNLQARDTKALGYLKVLRSFRYMIEPERSIDLNTNCGKIKECNLFYRHGRVLDLRPHEERADLNQLAHAQADGIDYELNASALNTCADAAQVFMIIQAWSPSRSEQTTAAWTAQGTNYAPMLPNVWTAKADPNAAGQDVPSYDMVFRQKYSMPV